MKKMFVLLTVAALCFAGCKSAVEDMGQVETQSVTQGAEAEVGVAESVAQPEATTEGETSGYVVVSKHTQGETGFAQDSDSSPYHP